MGPAGFPSFFSFFFLNSRKVGNKRELNTLKNRLMNLRNVIQVEQVPFLSGSAHRGTNVISHPNVNPLLLSDSSFPQYPYLKLTRVTAAFSEEITALDTVTKVSISSVLNRYNLE